MTRPTGKLRGFTLIELLIVVVILSTLAAIVVPQFASSSDSAKVAAAKSSLSGIRSALEVYRTEKGEYPLEQDPTFCTGSSLTLGSTAQDKLYQALSYYSNGDGEVCESKTDAHPQGPYLRAREFPVNPINNTNTVVIETDEILGVTATTTGEGWLYQPGTGQFIINITEHENE